MHQHLNVLEQRLSALERQNRRLKTLLMVLFALALAPLFVSAAAQQANAPLSVIRAEQFDVVKDGKTVLTLGSTAQGGNLVLFNTAGDTIGFLRVYDHGAALRLSHLAGKNAVVNMGANSNDTGFFYLGSGDGKSTVELEGSSTPSITLKDGQGAQTFRVP